MVKTPEKTTWQLAKDKKLQKCLDRIDKVYPSNSRFYLVEKFLSDAIKQLQSENKEAWKQVKIREEAHQITIKENEKLKKEYQGFLTREKERLRKLRG